jgi:hypothetical protein
MQSEAATNSKEQAKSHAMHKYFREKVAQSRPLLPVVIDPVP